MQLCHKPGHASLIDLIFVTFSALFFDQILFSNVITIVK